MTFRRLVIGGDWRRDNDDVRTESLPRLSAEGLSRGEQTMPSWWWLIVALFVTKSKEIGDWQCDDGDDDGWTRGSDCRLVGGEWWRQGAEPIEYMFYSTKSESQQVFFFSTFLLVLELQFTRIYSSECCSLAKSRLTYLFIHPSFMWSYQLTMWSMNLFFSSIVTL